MTTSTCILITTLIFMLLLSSPSSATSAHQLRWFPATHTPSSIEVGSGTGYVGTVVEQMVGEDEFDEVESESSRRMLAMRRYISYGALRKNTIPCTRRGASYYNCRRGAQANPYSRGCSAITRCRR